MNRPVKYRAIAPTGTIGIIASTTTGIEPMFAVAYKRRYLSPDVRWKYEYVIDATADYLIRKFDIDPESIETAYSLADDPERRIKFQYEVQKYVDHAISSTINLPAWGSRGNNDDTVEDFAAMLLKYVHGLRGITVYPDGVRGGQPLTEVPYTWALSRRGHIFDETEEKCAGGICGL
jgi:ribonucleoside-diphosphate reductase alpha chain